ncbi:recombinase RecT [Brevibacillus laterosporus]|uniref:Recombinase RecT n=1 Tax=Brevibacillus halotolerans TaxID=1507437 RepID=A0ABT4HYF3_9BACL|nr:MULTISPECIES: RecT family recombinase [Brevibacillus]MCR8986024.1 recombinase RecT [Brevibacillus laterosporus]MCZ0831757.1 recombinase RecT [Brevibacillus halotolerans]
MTTQLQEANTNVVIGNFTQAELDTLKATVAKGTTNEQFALFVQTCVSSGLNPFLNQIYCIVYRGRDGAVMSMQIAVEGIVALAKRNPHYKGFIASEVKEHDEFEINVAAGEVTHKITAMQRGKTIGAYCVAYREGAPNVAVVITIDQIEHLVKGRNKDMWRDYFDDMIVKHAMKRAFKRQFGIEIAETENVPTETSIENMPEYEPKQREVVVEVNGVEDSSKQESPTPSPTPPIDDEGEKLNKTRDEMKTKFEQLGIFDPEEMKNYIAKHTKVLGNKPTLAELTGLLKIMDQHIAEMNNNYDELD